MNALVRANNEPSADEVMLIPTDAYLSEHYARAEREALWQKVWQVACREEELAKVGDYVTYDVLDDSIVVVRTSTDTISAYHNVCPHRGRRLTEGCGHTKRFVCKYHGWKWALDGGNAAVVRGEAYGSKLTPDDVRLRDVKVATWGGFVFVNMAADCEPLEDFLGDVVAGLAPFQLEEMRFRWRQWLHLPCNWKVAIEAFAEGYHLFGTHPQIAHLSQSATWCRPVGLHSCYGSDAGDVVDSATSDGAQAVDVRQSIADTFNQIWEEVNATTTQTMVDVANNLVNELPAHASPADVQAHFIRRSMEEDAKQGVIWPSIQPQQYTDAGLAWHVFPNTVIVQGPTFALCYRARPHGYDPDRCVFEVYTLQRFAAGKEPKPQNVYMPTIDEQSWKKILCQDFGNMGDVQRGMKSLAFVGTRPHPIEERTLVNFHRGLAKYMGVGEPTAAM